MVTTPLMLWLNRTAVEYSTVRLDMHFDIFLDYKNERRFMSAALLGLSALLLTTSVPNDPALAAVATAVVVQYIGQGQGQRLP